jgi:hypothetical protein
MGTSYWKVSNAMKEHVETASVAMKRLIGGSQAKIIAERERVTALVKNYTDCNQGLLKV